MTQDRVRVLHPDIKITLYKLVRRSLVSTGIPAAQRYASGKRAIELTEWLTDQSGVHISKNVRSPAGSFSIDFADAPQGEGAAMDSLYGLIEPMDGIEIRMAHNHGGARGRNPAPVVMRGFVSRISRSMSLDSEGRPMRRVMLEGHDYGKIWSMLQIVHRPYHVLGETWLSTFPLFERFGQQAPTAMHGNDFARFVIDKIINPHLATMLPSDWPMPKALEVEAVTATGNAAVGGVQRAEGAVYGIMAQFLDVQAGFNELYLEDREDKVVVVYRPNPALDMAGQALQTQAPGTSAPTRHLLPASEIISLHIERSDADVANYFWVDAPRYELVNPLPQQYQGVQGAARDTIILDAAYPNSQIGVYGIRAMIVASQMAGGEVMGPGQDAGGQAAQAAQNIDWITDRRRVLLQTNRDNALWESGSVRIAGNELVRAGSFVTIGTGPLAALYYVAGVEHNYLPYKGFFTTLSLERGAGYIKRVQSAGQTAPYWLELGAGGGGAIPAATPAIGQAYQGGATPATPPASNTITRPGG